MKQLSERVQREFEKWQEKYEIPLHEEFQIKTLLQLQEEYDNIQANSNNTKTRDTLLHMIKQLHSSLLLKKKSENIMYVDVSHNFSKNKTIKISIYINGEIYTIENESKELRFKDYTSIISSIANTHKAIIYIDVNGFGIGLYEELEKLKDVIVKKLKTGMTNRYKF